MSISADFAVKPTLRGKGVLLRPFQEDDFCSMSEAIADPEVQRLTGSVHSTAEAVNSSAVSMERLRTWYGTRNKQQDRLDLAIVETQAGRCIGEAVLNEWDPPNESCNFRILIGPSGQGRGLGTEATRLMLAHAFETLGLYRVELEVYSFNPRARRAYEKAGFVAEGVRRGALKFDRERIDAIVMAILAEQWR